MLTEGSEGVKQTVGARHCISPARCSSGHDCRGVSAGHFAQLYQRPPTINRQDLSGHKISRRKILGRTRNIVASFRAMQHRSYSVFVSGL